MKNFICSLAIILSCFSISGAEQYPSTIAPAFVDEILNKFSNSVANMEVKSYFAKTEDEWGTLYDKFFNMMSLYTVLRKMPLTDQQLKKMGEILDRARKLQNTLERRL